MGLFADLLGTLNTTFQIAKAGVKLKNNAAALEIKAADGTTDAPVTASKVSVSGDVLEINSDAAGSGADWKYTIQRPATGMGAAVTLTIPPNDGSPGQVLQTDGNGVLVWATASVTEYMLACDTTTINWDTTPGAVAMLSVPVGGIVEKVRVIIDTTFNGTTAATLTVGTAGTPTKYMSSTQNDLKGTAKDVYEVNPGEAAVSGSPEAVIATFAAASGGSPSAGSVRVELYYTIPS